MPAGRRIVHKSVLSKESKLLNFWPPYRSGSSDFKTAFPLVRLNCDPLDALLTVGIRGLTSKGWRIYFVSQWIKDNPWVEDYFFSLENLPNEAIEASMCEIAETCIFSDTSLPTTRIQKLSRVLDIARSRYIM